MARAIVSLGMFAPLASETALRRRALASGSPPPVRAATEISLINLVKSLPRFASRAPFLCLIVCHFECPDMADEFLKKVCSRLGAESGGNISRGFSAPQLR